jgi:hypothetical protein
MRDEALTKAVTGKSPIACLHPKNFGIDDGYGELIMWWQSSIML